MGSEKAAANSRGGQDNVHGSVGTIYTERSRGSDCRPWRTPEPDCFPDQAPGEPWQFGTNVNYLENWSNTGGRLRLARARSAA